LFKLNSCSNQIYGNNIVKNLEIAVFDCLPSMLIKDQGHKSIDKHVSLLSDFE